MLLKAHANGRNKSQHCCVLLGVFSQQCCVRLHGPKSLSGFQTIYNKSQQVPTLLWLSARVLSYQKVILLRPMQTDATSHNIVACCWGFLANNVASVCMGLKVWAVSNYIQQVPTSANIVVVVGTSFVVPKSRTLKAHTNERNKSQQCCVLLPNNVASVCMGLYST